MSRIKGRPWLTAGASRLLYAGEGDKVLEVLGEEDHRDWNCLTTARQRRR